MRHTTISEKAPPLEKNPPKWETAVFWSLFAAFSVAYLWVHGLAGMSFPVPWFDEGSFLWPAIAFQEHGTLFTPELNPERHIMWMPPGYPLFMGAIFGLTGFSLEWARMCSALFMLCAFACMAGAMRSMRFPIALLLLAGGVFLGRHFVLMGNIARMESLLILATAASALLLVEGQRAKAFVAIAFGALIHPNGIYLAAAAALYLALGFVRRSDTFRPSRVDWLLIACVGVAWLAYAGYVSGHWNDFLRDMEFQFSWKKQPGPFDAQFWARTLAATDLVIWLLLLVLIAAGVALRAPSARLLVLAVPLHLMKVTPIEWYYQVFHGLLFLILSAVSIDLVGRAADRFAPGHRGLGSVAGVACFAAVWGIGSATGWIESPRGYPRSLRVAGLGIDTSERYLDADDERSVREFLGTLGTAEEPITVMFYPWADALLFHDLRSDRLRFVQPTFFSAEPDVTVIHLTRLIPDSDQFYDRVKLVEHVRGFPRIRTRNETEEWLYNPNPAPLTHGKLPN